MDFISVSECLAVFGILVGLFSFRKSRSGLYSFGYLAGVVGEERAGVELVAGFVLIF